MRSLSLLVGVLALGAVGGLAQASSVVDSVDLSTGYTPWNVQRHLVGGENDQTAYNGPARVIADPATPPWVTISGAEWVGWNINNGWNYSGDANRNWQPGNPAINGTSYTYEKDFTLIPHVNGSGVFSVDATLSTDNWISSAFLVINHTSIDLIAGHYLTTTGSFSLGVAYEYTYDYALNLVIPNTGFTSPSDFKLLINTVNNDGNSNPTPTGFILGGNAAATVTSNPVPLPGAAWLGFSMLGGMGLLAKLRRRKSSGL